MAIKIRRSGSHSHSAEGDHDNTELITHTQGTDDWEDMPFTVVDGILTVVTNTDDLVGVRLLAPVSDLIQTGDLTENLPEPEDSMVWYSWFAARGPLVFRVNTTRTVRPAHAVWLQVWKERGTTATVTNWGFNGMIQPHHR